VRVLGEMRALTAEGRISGLVLVLLPIALALVLTAIRPEYMATLIVEPIGHYLIGGAIVLQIIGGIVIKKMLVLDI
jgi:tight adherence protein B